jgi:sulfur relay (sulfurtransferase) DsrC/TusE family protein
LSFWWSEDENYPKMKQIHFDSFFGKLFWAPLKRRKIQQQIDQITSQSSKENEQEFLISLAESCLNTLEIFLKNEQEHFLNEITSFDAVVYGYLKCFLCDSFEKKNMNELISKHPKLVSFCERIEKEMETCSSELKLIKTKTKEWNEPKKNRSYLAITLASISIFCFLFVKIRKNFKLKE